MSRPSLFSRVAAACALTALLVACKSERDKPLEGLKPQPDGGADEGVGIDGGRSPTGGSSTPSGDASLGGGGRGQQLCPAARPANGSACVSGRGDCTIGAATCDCPSDTNKWVCWEPSDCPSVAPAEAAACTIVGAQCGYEQTPDAGRGEDELDCECTASGWDCGRQACPAAEPAASSACEGGDGVCTFGGRTCDCRGRTWVCWNASDCPAAPPAAATACPVVRMLCEYPADECECSSRGWQCESQEDEEEENENDEGEEDEEDQPSGTDGGVRPDAAVASDAGVTDAARAEPPADAGSVAPDGSL